MNTTRERSPSTAARMNGLSAYAPARATPAGTLRLDGNEGAAPGARALEALAAEGPELLRRYPDARTLEARLAARLRVAPEQVLVTAGADDALFRTALAFLDADRELVLPTPSFEMIARYAALAGGSVREVGWPAGPYPLEAVLAASSERTGVIAVVSPNNPTGAVARPTDVVRLCVERPSALVLVDAAYAEFDPEAEALTRAALGRPNALVVRSLSKAWGLAGLRVGYALGAPEVVDALRAAGSPYPVAGPALAAAGAWLERGEERMRAAVERVALEREQLTARLAELGARPQPSRANFVLARFDDAARVARELLARGVAVRAFPDRPGLEDALRVTCPGDEAAFARLVRALRGVLSGEPLHDAPGPEAAAREGALARRTRETDVRARVALDGAGRADVDTGVGFLDHMLEALARHAGVDLELTGRGDVWIDDHHTVEDCALVLGAALDRALGERRGIARFGSACAPLDEALARCALDLSGRPYARVQLGLRGERVGALSAENATHFLTSFATAARATLHLELLSGENDHHRVEAAFKALALALRQAVAGTSSAGVPSTKGVLA